MIRIAFALVALLAFALPAFAQSLPERLAAVERNNAALSEVIDAVKADVATVKMNQNAVAAEVDALKAEVARLKKTAPATAWPTTPTIAEPVTLSYSSGGCANGSCSAPAGLFGGRFRLRR